MKKILLVGALILASYAYAAHATAEVLVLASAAVEMPRILGSRGFEIFNNGPNTIYCALDVSSDAVVTKARPIASGTAWSADVRGNIRVYCKAATADQVTGAATIFTEAIGP